ncbi:hypothetical protein REPUB_Repub01dG0258600 [Reevesia pubescens]
MPQAIKIFSKSLTVTDINKRLAIPAKALHAFPDFNGSHALNIHLMYGTSVYPVVCSIRKKGHKKPVFSVGWRNFVIHNNFNVGDRLTLYKVQDEDGSFHYKVEVEKRYQIEGWSLKDVLAWFFLITNFILELPSAVFDQLSSKNHPHYAFIVMLISFIGFMACIGELIYKAKKERVSWKWGGRVPWFYCPRTDEPFGTLWDIIGFACAFPQCILTAINYSFISRHIDGPIKISALPIIFAFGLLCSKYLEKPTKTRGGNSTAQYGDSIGDLNQVLVQP